MFSPLIVAIFAFVAWSATSLHAPARPAELPGNIRTRGHVDWAWHQLTHWTAIYTCVIAMAALWIDISEPISRDAPLVQWTLFTLGLTFALDGLKAALVSAQTYAIARRTGRSGALRAGDYMAGWVGFPLFPLAFAIGY